MRRRTFLQKAGAGLLVAGAAGVFPGQLLASPGNPSRLTVLHTNDLHGQLQGAETESYWKAVIQSIRAEVNGQLLLLDAGDHFGLYAEKDPGREIAAMSALGYDAVIMGKNDMKMGFSNLSKQYNYANFKLLSSNYCLNNTPLCDIAQPFQVFYRATKRIGVFAVDFEDNELLNSYLGLNNSSYDPIAKANDTARHLREVEGCDLVLCISHLGFHYGSEKLSDVILAERTQGIDLLLGGNTHTFLAEPVKIKNIENQDVIVSQAGSDALLMGRIDVDFGAAGDVKVVHTTYLTMGAASMV